jgi:diadenylate cyclase
VEGLWNAVLTSLSRFDIIDAIDIAIITVLIYYLLKLSSKTRAKQVLRGIGFVLITAWLSSLLRLQTVSWLLNYVINSGVIALVIVFQPELRRALERLGRGRLLDTLTRTYSGSDTEQEITRALLNLSKQRVGALIAIQRTVALEDILETGTRVDGIVSASLLETIFKTGTALHDGAAIIHNDTLLAAGCFLPMTQRQDLEQTVGTRHRAAIGLSEVSDAIVFIVSEETGIISAAVEGRFLRNLNGVSIRALMVPAAQEHETTEKSLFARILNRKRKES